MSAIDAFRFPFISTFCANNLIVLNDSGPLRSIVGLDFGLQAVNDAVEPIRKRALEFMACQNFTDQKPNY